MTKIAKLYRSITNPFRRSIRNKLILTMVILSVLPIVTVTLLAAENNRRSMETEVIHTNVSNMKWTSIHLGEQFAQMNNLIYTFLINPYLNAYMTSTEDTSLSSQFTAQRNIIETLTSLYYSAGNHVVGAELYLSERGKLFTVNTMQSEIEQLTEIPPLYKELFEENKDFTIQTSDVDPSKFRLTRSINRFENKEKLGGVSLDIQWSALDQTIELLSYDDTHTVLIMESDGTILYQPNGAAPSPETLQLISGLDEQLGYIQSKDNYVFYKTIEPVGLKLVKIIPTSFINQSAKATMNYGFVVGAISVIVSILIAAALAWRTATPIVTLARSMQGLSLIKETEVAHSNRIDEIGLLETKLNNMSFRIREHIKMEYSMNLEKKTAELKALQAQINPHFLQNTLQLIGSILFSKSPSDGYIIIRSLSEMFRYIIREPDALATLHAEIEHLNNYMLIQKQRYASRLTYTSDINDETLVSLIPKLTLQPIVENAFFHGLEHKSGEWSLSLAIARDGPDVLISIRDNGIGMKPDQLSRLRARLDNQLEQLWTYGDRIGLNNVVSRIRMHFGPDYGITIESQPAIGTLVTIRIPFEAGGERSL